MAKAVISNKIYLDRPPEGFKTIEDALTFRIVPDGAQTITVRGRKVSRIDTIKTFTRVGTKVLAIPQGRTDLIPEGYEVIDKRVYNKVPFPVPKLGLNDDQVPVVAAITDSCIVNALPGWGSQNNILPPF